MTITLTIILIYLLALRIDDQRGRCVPKRIAQYRVHIKGIE